MHYFDLIHKFYVHPYPGLDNNGYSYDIGAQDFLSYGVCRL